MEYKMEKKNGFTLVELLVVIAIIGMILGMSVPNYNLIRERARILAQKMNMHNVATIVELYFAETGEYSEDFDEDGYGAFFPGGNPDVIPPVMGKLPTNPWTGLELDPTDDINVDYYDSTYYVTDVSVGGPNDDDEFDPGQMRFSTYNPPGSFRITMWGLIGTDRTGRAIREFDAASSNPLDAIIFVLHN